MLNNLDPVIAQALAPFVLPKLTDDQQRIVDFLNSEADQYAKNIPAFSAKLRGYANELLEYFQGVRRASQLSMDAAGYLYDIPKDQLGS
jgi:hypothetical protein